MEQDILANIDLRVLGRELQEARRKSGMKQEDAARLINVARTTLTAIEKGERRIKSSELIMIAKAYGRQVSDFVRPRPVLEPLSIQFRGPGALGDDDRKVIEPLVDELEELGRNYLELEQITGTPLVQNYLPEYDPKGLDSAMAAESLAIQERNRLGIGDGPIQSLRELLEQGVGIRIFYLKLPKKFSAIYVFNQSLGACIAINVNHPEERRRFSLCHDYAHFLAHRYRLDILIENGYQRLPESEKFADYFATYFLMPSSHVIRNFNEIRRSKEKITPADLLIMAHYYGVSFEAMALRLEDLRLIHTGTYERIKKGGFKVLEAKLELGLEKPVPHDNQLPERYRFLTLDAYQQSLITEGQLARFLRVDRLQARRLKEIFEEENGTAPDDLNQNLIHIPAS